MSGVDLSNIENNFQLLLKRCRLLYDEKQKLERRIVKEQDEIARQRARLEELEEQVKMLKMTNPSHDGMATDNNARNEMRTTLNAYIQEIDNCIARLNE